MSTESPKAAQPAPVPALRDPAAEGTISAGAMAVLIPALREIAGRNFEPLLLAAGLERYLETGPSPGPSPATRAELQRLYTQVYQMLGASLTRLFHRNLGDAYVIRMLQSPLGDALRADLLPVPPDQQLERLVRGLANLGARDWVRHSISEDATAWYLTSAECAMCAGLPQGINKE